MAVASFSVSGTATRPLESLRADPVVPENAGPRIAPERDAAVPVDIDHGAIPAARDGGDLGSENTGDCDGIDPIFRESEEPG